MKILHHEQIIQKIKRLAIEIVEQNHTETEIILAGINNNGYHFAELLLSELKRFIQIDFKLTRIRLNPANPIGEPIEVGLPIESLKDKVVIVVDDVANTGRTVFYACKPILDTIPKKIEVAVLVDRTHKFFPIQVKYVGMSLATTLKEHIDVKIINQTEYEVNLD